MDNPALDIADFYRKHRHMPEANRAGLWTFEIDGQRVSFWGTLAEASATASLYVRSHAIENPVFLLTDHCPMPNVFSVRSWEN